ncbi:MAG: PAS domain S-box protein [Desulfobacterales bacterium]|nr:PAS domain S-box protein [Desulfobacterales bacterium]
MTLESPSESAAREKIDALERELVECRRSLQTLKASEEKRRTVLENSLSAIYVFQDGGTFTYVNRRMVEILGYDHPGEIIGRKFWRVIAPEDREVVKERGLRREKSEIYPRRYTFRLLKKDGSVLWADMQAAHAYYMGSPAVIGNFIDITRIVKSEKEVKHLSRRLIEGIEEERRSLSADLHDEFGQLLTLLQFDTENLQNSLPGNLPESKAACREVAKRIQSLADSLRDAVSRLRPDLLDHLGLIPTIEWFLEDFRERVPEISIEFQTAGFKRRIASNTEIVIYRLFQEGLNNVAKHASARRVDILLTCSHPEVIFVMKDDGVGFRQSEHDGLPVDAGARGIGLLSMRERVASLGGRIEIKSFPGKGTVVRAEVPLDGKKAE